MSRYYEQGAGNVVGTLFSLLDLSTLRIRRSVSIEKNKAFLAKEDFHDSSFTITPIRQNSHQIVGFRHLPAILCEYLEHLVFDTKERAASLRFQHFNTIEEIETTGRLILLQSQESHTILSETQRNDIPHQFGPIVNYNYMEFGDICKFLYLPKCGNNMITTFWPAQTASQIMRDTWMCVRKPCVKVPHIRSRHTSPTSPQLHAARRISFLTDSSSDESDESDLSDNIFYNSSVELDLSYESMSSDDNDPVDASSQPVNWTGTGYGTGTFDATFSE